MGVFGKLKPLDAVLADHDRVEIYRPLLVDPKLSRQRRVEKTRKAGSIEGRRWQNEGFARRRAVCSAALAVKRGRRSSAAVHVVLNARPPAPSP